MPNTHIKTNYRNVFPDRAMFALSILLRGDTSISWRGQFDSKPSHVINNYHFQVPSIYARGHECMTKSHGGWLELVCDTRMHRRIVTWQSKYATMVTLLSNSIAWTYGWNVSLKNCLFVKLLDYIQKTNSGTVETPCYGHPPWPTGLSKSDVTNEVTVLPKLTSYSLLPFDIIWDWDRVTLVVSWPY